MSLRTSKIVLKSGLKNLSCSRFYTSTVKNEDVIVFVSGDSRRQQNELLGRDKKAPFPGGIGLDTSRFSSPPIRPVKKEKSTDKNISNEQRYKILEMLDNQMRIPLAPDFKPESSVMLDVLKADRDMELTATSCPKMLKKDLKTLFLDVEITREKNITVLNLTQKSAADMSAWSPEMEAEREQLTKDFINVAISICSDLQKLGNGKYWADFIEPSSGRPYFGKYTNAVLVETDESYRDLGFQIEDLGCCKVLKHVKWSTHAFVGTIFTDAPINSDEVKAILSNSKAGQYFQEAPESGMTV